MSLVVLNLKSSQPSPQVTTLLRELIAAMPLMIFVKAVRAAQGR